MPAMKSVLLITGNAGKAAEFSRLLGVEIHNQKVELPEVQSDDVRTIAEAKARAAFDIVKQPVFVDDTGLYIEAWNGLPGAFIAWFLRCVGNEGILKMLEGWDDRSARAVTALGYCDGQGARVFYGETKGSIAPAMRGTNGLGFDPIFMPNGSDKTYAELESHQKDHTSPRAAAARELREFLSR